MCVISRNFWYHLIWRISTLHVEKWKIYSYRKNFVKSTISLVKQLISWIFFQTKQRWVWIAVIFTLDFLFAWNLLVEFEMPFQPNQTGSFFLILVDSPIEIHRVRDLFQRDSLKRKVRKFMIFCQTVGDLSKIILPVAWKLTSLGSITCMSDFVKPLSSWLAMTFDRLGLVFSRMCFEQMRQNKQLQCHLYIETLSTVYTGNLCNFWNALSLEFAVQRNTFLSEL